MASFEQNRRERSRLREEEQQVQRLRNHPSVPKDFDWQAYLDLNPFLLRKGLKTEALVLRYYIKVGSRSGVPYKNTGSDEFAPDARPTAVSLHTADHTASQHKEESLVIDLSTSSIFFNEKDDTGKFNFENERKKFPHKTAVFLHVYYTEVLDEMLDYISKIDSPYDLYINIVEEKYNRQIDKLIKERMPKAKIVISENYGRDWGGYYRLSKAANLDEYDVIFLAHTKRSIRNGKETQDQNRLYFLKMFFGSNDSFDKITNLIRNQNNGIVSLKKWRIDEKYHKNSSNIKHTRNLFEKHGYTFYENINIEFSFGSLFAMHSSLLKNVLKDVYLDEFEKNEATDGLLPHSLERFPFIMCKLENIKITYIN